jgi:type IV secretion system protein VirB2
VRKGDVPAGLRPAAIGKSLTTVNIYGRFARFEQGWGNNVIEQVRRWFGAAYAAGAMAWASAALAQDSYSGADPQGSGVIVSAVRWLQGTLLGTVATVVAVIAVASVGFMMLTGRINWRYGATVILGCFILFGAASIVAGIQSTSSLGG